MSTQQPSRHRRNLLLGGATASLLQPLSLWAQGSNTQEIVIGGSIPMTGVFAFAGVGINAGMTDYVKIVNDAGGIVGRRVRYVPEDTAYKVDVSVAAFKKLPAHTWSTCITGTRPVFPKPSMRNSNATATS